MDKEQIKAIAEKADETATQYLQCAGEYHPDYNSVRDEHFYHAAISAYKAELLKEVGEPVAYIFKPNNELLWPHEVDQNVFASDPEDYDLLYTVHQPGRVAELEEALKAESATAWAQAHRLALELECLLLSCTDTAATAKWWESAHEALEQWRESAHEALEQWREFSPDDDDPTEMVSVKGEQ